MLHRTERNLDNIPVGSLGIIALDGCQEMGKMVDDYLVQWRREDTNANKDNIVYTGYEKDTYLINAKVPRFGSGEAKGIIEESVRGKDIYLMIDVLNYSLTYSLTGNINHMSPDDHFQNLKRIIAAVGGKARRLNVIMPFLYESRQHKRSGRESLDCALALHGSQVAVVTLLQVHANLCCCFHLKLIEGRTCFRNNILVIRSRHHKTLLKKFCF